MVFQLSNETNLSQIGVDLVGQIGRMTESDWICCYSPDLVEFEPDSNSSNFSPDSNWSSGKHGTHPVIILVDLDHKESN